MSCDQFASLFIQDCTSDTTGGSMQCKVPEVNLSLSPDESRPLSIGFRMDNVTQLLRLVNTSLRYYGDPDFHQLNNILELGQGVRTNLTITVSMTAPSVCKIECVCVKNHIFYFPF